MRRWWFVVSLGVLALLAAWALSRSSERHEPPAASLDTTEDSVPPPAAADLAARPRPEAPVEDFAPPPPAQAGAHRLHLVGVGPPDRPTPEVTFQVWTYARNERGVRQRMDLDPHRTTPNEAWFVVPEGGSPAWVAARADRGRLVAQDGFYVALSWDSPDPLEIRVPLFASAVLDLHVVDSAGRGVAGAQVVDAHDMERGAPTDAAGRTRIPAAAGSLFLHALATGYAASNAVSIDLAPGAHEEKTLVLGPGRVILGRAVDEGGIPLSGRLTGTATNGREQHDLAADGSFRFDTLLAPTDSASALTLYVSSVDGTRSARTTLPGPLPAGDGPLDLGAVRFVSLWPVPVRVVSARDEPVTGVTVEPVRSDGRVEERATRVVTEETGTTIWLADGTYEIRAKPFVVRSPATFTVAGPWRGPPVSVVLEDALVVKGACTWRGGGTPRWRMLHVRARGGKPEIEVVSLLDGRGRFSLALPESLHGASLEVAAPYATLLGGLAVPKDGSDLLVDLPPERALTLVLRAVDASGRPISFRWARFERVPSQGPLPEGFVTGPSADGEADFWPLLRGEYRVTVTPWDGPDATSDTFTLDRDGQVVTVEVGR